MLNWTTIFQWDIQKHERYLRKKKKILLLCSYLYSLKYYSNKMLFEKETYLEPDKLGHILAHGYKDLVIR